MEAYPVSILTVPREAPQGLGEITWTDLFCGAGGSSLGLHSVPGFTIKYGLNHWDLAVMAHQANFPDTDHEVTEIQDVHPSRFGRTDCAWFSPSCTHHAYCRGPKSNDPEAVRSRATMWDVLRWTEYHSYDVVVVENVIEVKLWCDHHAPTIQKNGKEKGCSCGRSFDDWQEGMEKLGYVAQEVHFNSQFAFVPQSRDRMYMIFSKTGLRVPDVDFRPPSWCEDCTAAVAGVQTWKRPSKGSARDTPRLHHWGRYGKQYVYCCPLCGIPAAPAVIGSWSIIDDSLPIQPVGSRARPIAPNTRKRIKVGLERLATTRPIQVQVGGNLFERPGYARVWSLDDPLRTVTTTSYMGMVVPQKKRGVATSDAEPTATVTSRSHLGLCMPAGGQSAAAKGLDEPSHTILTYDRLALVRYGGQAPSPRVAGEPTMGITAHDRQIGVLIQNMTNNVGRLTDEPAPPVTTGGNGFLVYNGNPGFVRILQDAAGTVTARDKQSLLVPPKAPIEITEADIDDCLFRMLQPAELQRAQAMHIKADGSPYLLEARVKTKRGTYKDLTNEQMVKMIGNAVSSPVATLIGYSVAEALAA